MAPFQVTGMTIGFPCTLVSSQNMDPKAFTDTSSVTGGGFKALLDYVDYNDKLEWVITENVHTLTQCRQKFGNECPINIQNRAMEQRGFVPAHALACSSKFGVPQSRSRCWGLYIKAGCLKAFAPDPCKLFVSLGSVAPSNVLDGNLACLAAPSGRKAIQDENSLKF